MDTPGTNCNYCAVPKSFATKSNLTRHIQKFHSELADKKATGKCQEVNCDFSFYRLESFLVHLSVEHNRTDYQLQRREFQHFNEFLIWKADFEEETCSQFNLARGKKQSKSNMVYTTYVCFQSSRSLQGHGETSAQDSERLQFRCSAFMKITENDTGVDVLYCPTHYGHDLYADLSSQKISLKLRDEIGSRLAVSADPRCIVRDIRKAAWGKLKNEAIPTRGLYVRLQDVYNIRRDLKLQWEPSHSCEFTAMDIEDAKEEQLPLHERSLLYLKNVQRKCSRFPELPDDTFLAVIQTPYQRTRLAQLTCNSFCIDATHGVCGQRSFKLVTLMGLDAQERGFPVAHCIVNHEDERTLSVFFKILKDQLNSFRAAWFLSDDAPAFFNAYRKVIGDDACKLLCIWHVRRNVNQWLHRNARSLTEAKSMFRNIMYARTRKEAESACAILEQYVESSEEASEYVRYYTDRMEEWALSCRIGAAFSTSAFIESYHRVFKRVHLGAKSGIRLDELYSELLDYIEQVEISNYAERLTTNNSYRLRQIRRLHTDAANGSANYDCERDSASRYICKNIATQSDHVVLIKSCPITACQMTCIKCNVGFCVHSFICDCPAAVGGFRSCRHVHLVCAAFSSILKERLTDFTEEVSQVESTEKTTDSERTGVPPCTLVPVPVVLAKSADPFEKHMEIVQGFLADAASNPTSSNLELLKRCSNVIQKSKLQEKLTFQVIQRGMRPPKARNSRLKRQNVILKNIRSGFP